MRLIDADELLVKIDDKLFKTDPTGQEQIGVLSCRRIIREQPTVTPDEIMKLKSANAKHACEICGKSYDHTNTLNIPSIGGYGNVLYDSCSEREVNVCVDCISALQQVVNDRSKNDE